MERLIQFTRRMGGPVYINPDHIVMVGSDMPNANPQNQAIITVVTSVHQGDGSAGPSGIPVQETIQQAVGMINRRRFSKWWT